MSANEIEIILHGRGGQGGVTASQILAEAAILSGKYKDCSSFPSFGAERRGAPVEAYCRISQEKIWTRSQIEHADLALILDETILTQTIINKLKKNAWIIVNTKKTPEEIYKSFDFGDKKIGIITADLIEICFNLNLLNQENQPIVNTPILGLITRVPIDIGMDAIEKAIENHFGKNKKTELNITAAKKAAEIAKIGEFPS